MCPNEPQNCEKNWELSLTESPVVNIHIVSVGSSLFLEVKGQILILQTIAKTWQVKHYKETRNVGLWLLWLSVSIIQFLPKWFARTLDKQKPQNGSGKIAWAAIGRVGKGNSSEIWQTQNLTRCQSEVLMKEKNCGCAWRLTQMAFGHLKGWSGTERFLNGWSVA